LPPIPRGGTAAHAGSPPEKTIGPSTRSLPEAETDILPAGGERLEAGAEPVPGYRLVRPLGRGGFGEVWEATAPGGFKVALKIVPLDRRAGDVELRALEIVKDVRHPNLLTLFGAWHTSDRLVIGMELADRTLWDRFEEVQKQGQSGIPVRELLRYSQEAAKVLDYLNKPRHFLGGKRPVGIQHCDVKPQNILLVGEGVKVADFGLMQLLEHRQADYLGGLTCSYAAPEFFQGQLSRWSDQYSLAVTYCQLRGGRLPFTGNAAMVQEGHLRRPPDLTMLPEKESQAVARALAKSPQRRWPNCRTFVRALVESSRGDGQPASKGPAAADKSAPPKGPTLVDQILGASASRSGREAHAGREFVRDFLTRVVEQGQHGAPATAAKGWLQEIDGLVSAQVQEILEHPEFKDLSGNWQRQWERAQRLGPGVRDAFPGTLARAAPELVLQVRNRLADESDDFVVELQFVTIDDFEPAGLVQQVPALRRLAELRQRLATLLQKLEADTPFAKQLIDALTRPEKLQALAREVGLPLSAEQAETPPATQAKPPVPAALGRADADVAVTAPSSASHRTAPAAPGWMASPAPRAPKTLGRGQSSLARKLLAGVFGLVALAFLAFWAYLAGIDVGSVWDPISQALSDPNWQIGLAVGAAVMVLLGSAMLFLSRRRPVAQVGAAVPSAAVRPPLRSGDLYKTRPKPASGISAAEAAQADLTLSSPLSPDVLQRIRGGAPPVAEESPPEPPTVEETPPARPQDELRCLEGHTDSVWAVTFLPDGFTALSGGADNTLRLWYLGTGREADRFEGHTEGVTGVAVTADGRRALSGSLDGSLRLWDLSGSLIRVITGHADEVTSVALTRDGRHALSGSRDGTVRLWDVETGQEVRRLEGHTDWVHAVALSPDGSHALSGGKDRVLRLWDVKTGKEVRSFEGHSGWVHAVAFAPDGKQVLSGSGGPFGGSSDHTLRLWDVATGKELRRFTGHNDWVRSVAFAPDGERVVSGSDDETVRVWNAETGKELRCFEGHTWSVLSVAFAPKGRWVLSASDDKTVRLWQLP
jgi:type VI secretion system ImpB/VipA family protein